MTSLFIHSQNHTYPIYIGRKTVLKKLPLQLELLIPQKRLIFITSPRVSNLYWKIIEKEFGPSWKLKKIIISDQEKNKTLEAAQTIISQLLKLKADRSTYLAALGGGVIGDLAGFAASIYMRGIPFISIPTTFLSQVDSSIGGKCGVNLKEGKNLVGSFYPPKAVFCDLWFLETLPKEEFRSGLAEVIKYALLQSSKNSLFNILMAHKDNILKRHTPVLEKVIAQCIHIKKKLVEKDEKDISQRHFLNLGHTIGHALEKSSHYKNLRHGEAIAQGIYFAAGLSLKKSLCHPQTVQKIHSLLNHYQFLKQKLPSKIFSFIETDKKRTDDKISWVLLKDIGKPCLYSTGIFRMEREK